MRHVRPVSEAARGRGDNTGGRGGGGGGSGGPRNLPNPPGAARPLAPRGPLCRAPGGACLPCNLHMGLWPPPPPPGGRYAMPSPGPGSSRPATWISACPALRERQRQGRWGGGGGSPGARSGGGFRGEGEGARAAGGWRRRERVARCRESQGADYTRSRDAQRLEQPWRAASSAARLLGPGRSEPSLPWRAAGLALMERF